MKHRKRRSGGARILILLENLPLQRDGRVKRECRALLDAGYTVTVVCPHDNLPMPADLSAVHVRTWRAPRERSTPLGFVFEYAIAFVAMLRLTIRAWRDERFDVIQACNPPDFLFVIAMPFKLFGVRFVFDHHDLAPEMFTSRYGHRLGAFGGVLRVAERATYACADHAIVTNDSIRALAARRDGAGTDMTTVVRNGPQLAETVARPARPELRDGRRFMCVWHGVMGGVDDGLDLAFEAVAHLVHDLGREDCHFAFVGDGETRPTLHHLASRFDVSRWISLPGWQPLDVVYEYLSSAHIGLAPDPATRRVELSTTMKVIEFMAMALPVVAFDARETRVSAADAAIYIPPNDTFAYAKAIDDLLDAPDRRDEMGKIGRERVENELAWDHQRVKYIRVIDSLVRGQAR